MVNLTLSDVYSTALLTLSSGSSWERWRSWPSWPPWTTCKCLIALLPTLIPYSYCSSKSLRHYGLILKGVAGERGEQGPPGVNGFQVNYCFRLVERPDFDAV